MAIDKLSKVLTDSYQALASEFVDATPSQTYGSLLDERGRLILHRIARIFPELVFSRQIKLTRLDREIHKVVSRYYKSNWLSKR